MLATLKTGYSNKGSINCSNKNFQIRNLIILTLATLVLSACELQDNAKKSADNSSRAADNSEKVGNLSEQAYLDGRQAAARRTRAEEWSLLQNSNWLQEKTIAAAAYFCGFEFQLWKNTGISSDTPVVRESLYAEAIREFMRQIETVADHFDMSNPESFELPCTSSRQNSLGSCTYSSEKLSYFAIAGTVDKVSHRQEEGARKYKFDPVSMLTLLLEGINLNTKFSRGEISISTIKPYQYELLSNAQKINYLLQARQAMFTQIILSQLALVAVADPTQGTWSIDFTKLNSIQKDGITKYIKGALQSRLALGQLQIKPQLPKLVSDKLLSLQTTTGGNSETLDHQTVELVKLLSALKASQ